MCVHDVYVYVCGEGGSSIFLTSRPFPDNVRMCVYGVCVYVLCVRVCVWGGGVSRIFLTSRQFPDIVCVQHRPKELIDNKRLLSVAYLILCVVT